MTTAALTATAPTVESLSQNFLAFAVKRLEHSEKDINACLGKLTDVQVWERGGDHENSVANLLLHLEGNMRQWILHGIAGQPDVRQRDHEFTLEPSLSVGDVSKRFADTIAEVAKVIAAVPADRLLEVINPQPGSTWQNLTILEAIFQVVGHVQQHTGQIILLTKQMTAQDLDLAMPRKR